MVDTELRKQMDYIRSRMDILDCVNRYARGQDRLDSELTTSAFHPDAVLDFGVFVGDPAAFVDYFYDLHRRYHHSTSHIICNHVCEIDGDRAYAETYFMVTNNNREGKPFHLGGGRYVDQFERRAGRWAIAVRKCIAEWNADSGGDLAEKLGSLHTDVGRISRDRDDVSYERPMTVPAERLGLRVPV